MTVKKVGDKWETQHCHGASKGKKIASFKTKKEAVAQHRKIEIEKNKKVK